jgi:hypothetical protein
MAQKSDSDLDAWEAISGMVDMLPWFLGMTNECLNCYFWMNAACFQTL